MPDNEGGLTHSLRLKLEQMAPRFFGEYHIQVQKNREYYHLRYGPRLTKDTGINVLVPPTAARAIDEPADHILTQPRIKVPVRPTEGDQKHEQEIAEKKRKFANVWWSQVNQRFNPIGDGRKSYLNEGKIAIRKTLRWDLIPDKPGEGASQREKDAYRRKIANLGREEWLWNVELLDNVTVYEDPTDHRDPKYVYLKYKILVEDAKKTWPGLDGEWTRLNDFDEVEYVEYWSKPETVDGETKPGKFVQWIEMDVVHEADNPYPYIPIVIEDAGFGVSHYLAKPHEKFVGMTQHAFPVFEAEAIQMTTMQEVTKVTGFPLMKARNLPDDKQIQVGPGQVLSLEGAENDPNKEDVEVLAWPEVPASVVQMLEKTDRLANSTFKMDVLGGLPQRGVDTATEADMNIRNATAKLSGPIAGLERLVMRLTAQVFMDIEQVLGAPVTVFGAGAKDPGEVTLNPTDINGYYQVSVELSTTDEDAIAQNKARFWMEAALRNPFLSYTTAMERGGITDEPQNEMMKRAAEDAFLSEQFRMIRIFTAAQAFGELATLMEQMGATAQGAAGGEGVNTLNTVAQPSEQESLFNQSLVDRDVAQGASALRA